MAAVAPTPVEPARQASGRPGKLRLGDVLVQQRLISQNLRTHAIVANSRYSYGYASALHLGPSAIHHFYFIPAPLCPH